MSPTNDAIGPSPPFASPHCFFSFCWQLYGFINIATREWKDGLLSVVMRDYQNAPDSNPKWVILDGDLDANWIENMNSVMDDNRLLTLASNERIRMLMNMKMIFEIRDLAFASPATVTRAGVLYITDSAQWKNYVQAWLDQWAEGLNLPRSAEKMRAEFRTKGAEMVRANRAVSTRRRPFGLTPQLIPLPCAPAVTHPHLHAAIPRSTTGLSQFEKYCDKTLLELEINFRHVVPLLDFGLVQTITNFLQGLWTIDNLGSKDTNAIEIYFVFAAVWGFGGGFTISSGIDFRKKFSQWWKDTWKDIKFPHRGEVYDVFVDKAKKDFVSWSDIVPELEYDSTTTKMSLVTVPTMETVAISFFLDNLLPNKHGMILIGAAGCGKTAMINGKLRTLSEDYGSLTININYFTNSKMFQSIVRRRLPPSWTLLCVHTQHKTPILSAFSRPLSPLMRA